MEPPEIIVLLTNLKITNCKIAVKDTDSNVRLGTNESAISEFNNALRISFITLK